MRADYFSSARIFVYNTVPSENGIRISSSRNNQKYGI